MLTIYLVNDFNKDFYKLEAHKLRTNIRFIDWYYETIGSKNGAIINTPMYKKSVVANIKYMQQSGILANSNKITVIAPIECVYDACLYRNTYFKEPINWVVFDNDKNIDILGNLKKSNSNTESQHKIDFVTIDSGTETDYIINAIEHIKYEPVISTTSIDEIKEFLDDTNFDELFIKFAYGMSVSYSGLYTCGIKDGNELQIVKLFGENATNIRRKLRVARRREIMHDLSRTSHPHTITEEFCMLPITSKHNNKTLIELNTTLLSENDGVKTYIHHLTI